MREEAVSVRDVVTITIVWLPGGGLIRHSWGGAASLPSRWSGRPLGNLDIEVVQEGAHSTDGDTGSNRQQSPAVWTWAVLCKAGLGVPAGLLVVQGRAQGSGKIVQAMQRVLRQKGQMFFCERGRLKCAGIQILHGHLRCRRYK